MYEALDADVGSYTRATRQGMLRENGSVASVTDDTVLSEQYGVLP